ESLWIHFWSQVRCKRLELEDTQRNNVLNSKTLAGLRSGPVVETLVSLSLNAVGDKLSLAPLQHLSLLEKLELANMSLCETPPSLPQLRVLECCWIDLKPSSVTSTVHCRWP